MTDVRITVSYNDNSNQFKNFKLYDSKCRTCDDRSLSLKPVMIQYWNKKKFEIKFFVVLRGNVKLKVNAGMKMKRTLLTMI